MFLVNWTLTRYLKPVSFSWFIYTLQIERIKINKIQKQTQAFSLLFLYSYIQETHAKKIISKIYLLKLCTTLHSHP